jgi:hypothetical protein
MPRVISHSAAAAALAVAVAAAIALPAQAQDGTLVRSYVSSAGSDSNPCTITAPCASFAHAYTMVGANGIVAALDPGRYGPLTITGPVTINGNGWAAITAPSGGAGITINAGASDAVTLSGLEIDGAGVGYNGIVFNSGASLTVTGCVLRNFQFTGALTTGNGILIQPTSGAVSFVITNTTVANSGRAGIIYSPTSGSTATATGVIDHVVATNNIYGILIYTISGGGLTTVAISNSIASNNDLTGIGQNNSAALTVSIDNTEVSGNTYGIGAAGTTTVTLGRSVVTANGTGISNDTNSFFSYKDNRINENSLDISGSLNTLTLQ